MKDYNLDVLGKAVQILERYKQYYWSIIDPNEIVENSYSYKYHIVSNKIIGSPVRFKTVNLFFDQLKPFLQLVDIFVQSLWALVKQKVVLIFLFGEFAELKIVFSLES